MPYFNENQLAEFYTEYANDYPFNQGGESFAYTDANTGECAYICIAPLAMFDKAKLIETREHIITGETNLDDSDIHYGTAFEHGSDTGIEGWNLFADIYTYSDEKPSRWATPIQLISITVPLPSVSAPEHESFPGDETREVALQYAIERILDQLG